MAYDTHKNFGYSTVLSGGVVGSSSGTTLTVQSNDGSNFSASMNVTVWPAGVNPTTANAEIMRITNVLLDTLTVTRAQEGSSVLSNITAGYQVADTITAKDLTDVEGLLYNPYKFSVYRTAAYTTAASTTTVFPFDTRNFDTSSNVDITTNKGRFTVPIAGYYQFNANIELGTTAETIGVLLLFKNGIAGTQIGRGNDLRVSTADKGLVLTAFVQLAANDFVELAYFTDSAVAADVTNPQGNNCFSGFLVSTT